MNIKRIANVTGSHLTATEKRQIRAILSHPDFITGQDYGIQGSPKTYRFARPYGQHFEVQISQNMTNGHNAPAIRRTSYSEFDAS